MSDTPALPALDDWTRETDAADDDRAAALDLVEQLPLHQRNAALTLAVEMWPTDPEAWRHNPAAPVLGAVEHLAVMVAGLSAELVDGNDPRDARLLFDMVVSGPHVDANRAAWLALEDLGALGDLGALTQDDFRRESIPDNLLDDARKIATNTAPGRVWVESETLGGWLLFREEENP